MLKLLFSLSILAGCLAFAQENRRESLATTVPSGTFLAGDDFSQGVIELSADGMAESNALTCFGNTNAIGRASYEAATEQIRIDWNPNPADPTTRPATRFDVVRWGERIYLVDHLPYFINEINAGDEPRTTRQGMAYLHVGDWQKPVSGEPTVPKQYASSVFLEPLRGVVRSKDNLVGTVNLGTADGVFVGMYFYTREGGARWTLEVVGADERTCSVKSALNTVPVAAHVSTRRVDPLPTR
jgi:hypothetical protein